MIFGIDPDFFSWLKKAFHRIFARPNGIVIRIGHHSRVARSGTEYNEDEQMDDGIGKVEVSTLRNENNKAMAGWLAGLYRFSAEERVHATMMHRDGAGDVGDRGRVGIM